jgi:hypothetical protein
VARMILHAARWPFSAVFGILLGKQEGSNTVVVEDAIPVFHVHKNLAPMLEIALLQVCDLPFVPHRPPPQYAMITHKCF